MMNRNSYFTYPIPTIGIIVISLFLIPKDVSSFVIRQPNRNTASVMTKITSSRNIHRLPFHEQNNFYNTQSQWFNEQQQSERQTVLQSNPTQLHMMPDVSHFLSDSVSLVTAVEVFDGSTIVDPVVVSNAFWGSFETKVTSFILGEVLASIAFVVVVTLATQQLTKLGTFVTETIFRQPNQSTGSLLQDQYYIQPDFGKLIICIIVDSIGTSSSLLPFIGDVSDIVWAPIAGLIVRSLYGSNILFALEFAEEILPLTDILPLATICWIIDTFFYESNIARILQLGRYKTTYIQNTNISDNKFDVPTKNDNNNNPTPKIIDVEIENNSNKFNNN